MGAAAAGRTETGFAGLAPVALAIGLFAAGLGLLPLVAGGETLRVVLPWVPSLGVSLSFLLDGLSLTFALLISGIGALVFLYSATYLGGDPQFRRFALFLTLFMLAMLGLVLADNLITLFVFWELTTVTSYLLIGFGHERATARRAALQALFVTGAGALALLAGFILLGQVAGSFELSVIRAQGEAIRADPLYLPILILILAGAFTKSAQMPFHFWLPNAMAAPTPVSAFLHSATMVKAGVYLLARLHPTLSGPDPWFWSLTVAGGVTAVLASLQALRQTDLKLALAWTTLMALGTLTLLLGQSSAYALTAFATFLVVHSLYKAALFLMVGCVDHATGTREAGVLGGLARAMPVSAAAATLAGLSMAGVPPLLGFIGKELAYAGALDSRVIPELIAAALVLANALMVAVAGIVAFGPFWRPASGPLPQEPREVPWTMLAGPVVLAALGLLFGLAPGLLQDSLIGPTVTAVTGPGGEARRLTLWAGVNLPLVLSLVTLALGLVLWWAQRPLRAALVRLDASLPGPDRGWDGFLAGLARLALWQTRHLQSGDLRHYLRITLATLALTLGGTMVAKGALPGWPAVPELGVAGWKSIALVVLLIAGAALAAVTSSRVTAMAALGVVGIAVAMIFITFGAPDVAITQLLAETLVVVLIAVALLRLPVLDPPGRRDHRPKDAALALGVGVAVTLTLLAVLQTPLDRRLTDYFEATSWPEAFGRNIVNVILVDFRALDTFGEIAVVAIAALSAHTLLRATGRRGGR